MQLCIRGRGFRKKQRVEKKTPATWLDSRVTTVTDQEFMLALLLEQKTQIFTQAEQTTFH